MKVLAPTATRVYLATLPNQPRSRLLHRSPIAIRRNKSKFVPFTVYQRGNRSRSARRCDGRHDGVDAPTMIAQDEQNGKFCSRNRSG
jgi:hypothetical protein